MAEATETRGPQGPGVLVASVRENRHEKLLENLCSAKISKIGSR